MKSCGLTIQMEAIEQSFHMVLFIFKDFTKSNLGSVLNFDFRHSWKRKGLFVILHITACSHFVHSQSGCKNKISFFGALI